MGNYYPQGIGWSVQAFGFHIPLMQMSYLGSLKAWLYAPLFAVWPPSAASVRFPMLLAGAATLWLLYLLLRQCVSKNAGLIAIALLALDPMMLWTTRCDWGPVALQHLLGVSGVYAFVSRRPAIGAFLFGLAVWDKTTFIWILAGLAAATLLLLRNAIREQASPRTPLHVLVAFVAGAAPLIAYNIAFSGETARQTAEFSLGGVTAKVPALIRTLDGSALFGYLVRDDFRGPRTTIMPWLLAAAIVAGPWWWRTQARLPALFFLLTSVAAWYWMAVTAGAGESAHHLVLLLPWPHCFMAVVLAKFPGRVGAAIAGLGLISCALVTGNYYAMLIRNGADPPWSDAIYGLDAVMRQTRASRVYAVDWGILDPLRLLSKGMLPFHPDAGMPPRVDDPTAVYIGHTDRYQAFEGINAKVIAAAAEIRPVAFRKLLLATVKDSRGIPVFEVFRFVPAEQAPSNAVR
jgi:hypothetical protein